MFLVKPCVCHALQYRTYFRKEQFQFSVVEKRIKTYQSVSNTMVMSLSQLEGNFYFLNVSCLYSH